MSNSGSEDADASAGDTTDGAPGPRRCSAIPEAADLGESCTATCGPGAVCVQAMPGEPPVCSAVCVPGFCDSVCPPSQACVPTNDYRGQAILLDLDRDGIEDSVGGACVEPALTAGGPFEACAGLRQRTCDTGLACAAFTNDATVGTCLPACESDCDLFDGFLPSCFGVGDPPSRCLISCTSTTFSDDCPAGLTCRTVVSGLALCLR